jgi:hypothetical protein
MKTKIGILVLALGISYFNVQAQRRVTTTTRATSYDISDNLDLDAVSSIFGESKDLEDFEYRLNDPENRISNLDLNNDGYVDYLRVLETTDDRNSLVVIQAVLDKDLFQDVATIEIERVPDGRHRIQVVGDSWIYGPNYIVEPIYVRTPLIFSFFWGPRYAVYHSPYYWGYYPRWYHRCKPYPVFRYHRHVHFHVNRHNTYHRINERHFHFSNDKYNHIRRNDFATRYPDRSFQNRHRDVSNRNELVQRRSNRSEDFKRNDQGQRSSDRVHSESQNRRTERYEGSRNNNEYQRPGSHQKSGNIQQRESSRNSERSRPEYNRKPEQKSTESYERRSEPTRKPEVREGSYRRIEQQRSTTPREKSGTVQQDRSRSNSEVKQAPRVQRSEPKKEEKKENSNRRRSE